MAHDSKRSNADAKRESDRQARLAAELRANLSKRKALTRSKAQREQAPPESTRGGEEPT
jgi:hypothetical protein